MRGPEIREGKLDIDCSLPIQLEYTDAIKIKLKNPTSTRISRAALEFHPYFIFEYTLDITRNDPVGGTHPGKSKGMHIIDALSGRFLSRITGTRHFNPFHVLYHKDNQSNEYQEAIKDGEVRQLLIDLTTIKPVVNDQIA